MTIAARPRVLSPAPRRRGTDLVAIGDNYLLAAAQEATMLARASPILVGSATLLFVTACPAEPSTPQVHDATISTIDAPDLGVLDCAAVCERASMCITQVGLRYDAAACDAFCGGLSRERITGSCGRCLVEADCTQVYRDPTAPFSVANGNPGDCIVDCGLGECNRDGDCPGSMPICAYDAATARFQCTDA
ncbi:MAG: hypothetical protein SFX73_15010 [Kofleriaceae bacterium]|nr:hypothetical protein [Kofleriaceae bacterium]